jgi:translation elongation factor Tu
MGANALPVYESVDYSALQAGTEFLIIEGGNIVGEGIVKEIFQHKPHGKK